MRLAPAILCVVISWAWVAHAEPRVAILMPEEPTEASARVEERLRAELSAAGYEVLTVSVDGPVDRVQLRAIARRTDSSSAVTVVVGPTELEGAVWVRDEATGRESLESVRPARATHEGAAVFAIWAAEQLRASLLAFEPVVREATPAPRSAPDAVRPAPVVAPPEVPPARERRSSGDHTAHGFYGLSGGLAVLLSHGTVPWGVGPTVGLSWQTERWLGSVRVTGPVSSTVGTSSGRVDIDQELLTLRAGALLRKGDEVGRLTPFVALGVGAYRLGARGDAIAPYRSASNQAWSGLIEATGGCRMRLSTLVFASTEGGVWMVSSRPVIKIAGAPNAGIAHPGYVGSLSLGLSW